MFAGGVAIGPEDATAPAREHLGPPRSLLLLAHLAAAAVAQRERRVDARRVAGAIAVRARILVRDRAGGAERRIGAARTGAIEVARRPVAVPDGLRGADRRG